MRFNDNMRNGHEQKNIKRQTGQAFGPWGQRKGIKATDDTGQGETPEIGIRD